VNYEKQNLSFFRKFNPGKIGKTEAKTENLTNKLDEQIKKNQKTSKGEKNELQTI